MRELKAYRPRELVMQGRHNEPIYLKSEADKAIDELKKEKEYVIEQTAEVINGQEEELRHHKYKRCLTMARWCVAKSNYHFVLARHGKNCKENNRRSILYAKWHKRWLAIAEKFKPNSTAQQGKGEAKC